MKLSTPSSDIKVTRAAVRTAVSAAVLATYIVATGCAAQVAQAPFSARNDTVAPGDLLGPFDGRVVDAASGKPISGAVVFGSWGFEVGHGLTAPSGASSVTTETDSDGRYVLPRLEKLPGSRSRVQRFTLVIYKRGFVAYRSDRRFDDGSVRHDFSQHLNLARLDPAQPSLSHVKHVLFAGGGAPIRRAMAGEIVQASLEASGLGGNAPPPGAAVAAPLDASPLLSIDELKAVTGFAGDFTLGKLADLPSSPTYDSRHFRAVGKPESYDAALRVWKLPTAEAADAEYARLLKTVPHAAEKNELGDRSLRGYDGRILAAAAEDRARGVVIELTCGVDQCRDGEQAVALLKRVFARADKLVRAPEEKAAPAAEEKTEEKTEEKSESPSTNPFQLKQPELHR
jgi:hypothetical protein